MTTFSLGNRSTCPAAAGAGARAKAEATTIGGMVSARDRATAKAAEKLRFPRNKWSFYRCTTNLRGFLMILKTNTMIS